ncbi:Sodium/hydrogen exchanger [Entamoeba marina]
MSQASSLSSESLTSESSSESFDSYFELTAFVIVVIFLISIFVQIIIKLVPFLHIVSESIVSLAIGMVVGLIALGLTWIGFGVVFESRQFAHIFQTIFLPCIIFNAGFTMKKRNFFKNILPILSFAIGGCALSSLMIGFGVYGYTFITTPFLVLDHNLSLASSLQFGTLLGATDPVATLALFLELNVDPLLYSLVFGESVMNDAVSIVLFESLDGLTSGFEWYLILIIIAEFLVKAIGSCLIGIFVSYTSAFIMNRMKKLHLSGTLNLVMIVGVAFLAYFISELLEMSGILSIFVSGAIMSHHHWYSVPEDQRSTLYVSVGTLSFVSDTFTFISVGITLFNPNNLTGDCWNPVFIIYVLMLCFVSRACNVFPISLLMNLRKGKKISFRHMMMLWFAGLRGAIAIILCVQMNNPIITNTTYTIVLFTNIVIGMLTPPLLKLFKIEMGGDEPLNVRPIIGGSTVMEPVEEKNKFHKLFNQFDQKFLKRWFGGKQVDQKEETFDKGLETDREKVDRKFHGDKKDASNKNAYNVIQDVESTSINMQDIPINVEYTPSPSHPHDSYQQVNSDAIIQDTKPREDDDLN